MKEDMSVRKLPLRKIKFGKTDAFNELLEFGSDYFLDLFVENERYQKQQFLDGNKYYIVGKKGTGKTAFLRYLECQLNKSEENLVIPIRFKSDFDELDKEHFASITSDKQLCADDTDSMYETNNIVSQKSYVLMWKTFLIYKIISCMKRGEYAVFDEYDKNYKLMFSLLKEIYGENEKVILPKLKKGNIEISTKLANHLETEVKLEGDFEQKTKRVSYAKLAKKIVDLFADVKVLNTPVYILIDELELSVRNQSMYQKDIALVRDLILAVDDVNKMCRQKSCDIHMIASIRSEVVTSVVSAGFEVNKCIEDFGITINWFQKGGNYLNNPLLQIIERRIHASEKANGISPSKDIWNTYFQRRIRQTEVRKYILSNTWYRPRDIVRLISLLQTESSEKDRFDQESFDRAQQEYSNKMWTEFSEELRLSYTSDDLIAIKIFFTKIPLPFTFDLLKDRVSKLSEIDPKIKSFFDKVPIAEFIQKMFVIGVIGNTGERVVFSFLGDQEISMLDQMIIHNPLRNFFAVQSLK